MIAITNARVVLEHEIIENGVIIVDGERIAAVGDAYEIKIPNGTEIYDAKGLIVGPGFVDIHVHGGNGHFFYEDPLAAAEHFLAHGETTVLATLYYDLTKDEFIAAIERVKAAMGQGMAGNAIGGFYMEGPYMNPKYGACLEDNKWRGEIKPEDFNDVVEAAADAAKVWAVAPEREGIETFLEKVKTVNPNAIIAVGHSEATPAQVKALKKYGIGLQTHCMNATGRPNPLSAGTRSCGPDEACLIDPDIYCEMICDSQGIHVPPDMQEFIIFIKGIDKVVLISDSYVSDEPVPPEFAHITDLQFDSSGGLCGSKLTLDVAVKNVMKHTGCGLCEAFLMASQNPARAVGMGNEIGSITVGKRADLVIVNDEINVENVMLRGTFLK